MTGAESSGYVTPLVRKMASEAGIDLSTVKGSGLGGRIRKQDVQQAIDAQKSAARPLPGAPRLRPGGSEGRGVLQARHRGEDAPNPQGHRQRMMESLHGRLS